MAISQTAILLEASEVTDEELAHHGEPVRYRGYIIQFDPPPIPIRSMDWHYVHENYDGPEDSRHGHAASYQACKDEIDEIDPSPQLRGR